LADVSVARIEYPGEVVPKIKIEPALQFTPFRALGTFDMAPFAMINQLAAEIHR
jgi:hypothetical protein